MAQPYYDPQTDSAKDLSEEEKLLLAATLRQPGVGPAYVQIAQNNMDRTFAQSDLNKLRAKRQAQQDEEASNIAALRKNPNPTYQDMLGVSTARPDALKGIGANIKQQQDIEMYNKVYGAPSGGSALPQTSSAMSPGGQSVTSEAGNPMSVPGQVPPQVQSRLAQMSNQQLVELSGHPVPMIAAAAKHQLEYNTKGLDPNHFYRAPGQDNPGPLSGALGFLNEKAGGAERAKSAAGAEFDVKPYPIGGGASEQMTTADYLRRKGAYPSGTSASPPAGPTPVPSPTPSPGNAPSSPVASPTPAPMPAPAPTGSLPPQLVEALQRVAPLPDDNPVKQQVLHAVDVYMKAAGKTFDQPVKPQTAQVSVSEPRLPQNGPGFGQTDPLWLQRQEGINKIGNERLDRYMKAGDMAANARQVAQQLEVLSKEALSGGMASHIAGAAATGAGVLGLPVPDAVAKSEEFEAVAGKLYKEMLSAFGAGNGISNLDLLTVERQLPSLSKSKEGRDLILQSMTKAADINEYNAKMAMEAAKAGKMDAFKFDSTAGGRFPVNNEKPKGYGTAVNSPASFASDLGRSAQEMAGTPMSGFNVLRGVGQALTGDTESPVGPMDAGVRQGRELPEGLLTGLGVAGGMSAGPAILKGGKNFLLQLLRRNPQAVEEAAAASRGHMKFKPNQGSPYSQ